MTRGQTGIGAAVRAAARNHRGHRLVVGPQAQGAGGIEEAIVQKSDMQRLSKMRQHRSQAFLIEDAPRQIPRGDVSDASLCFRPPHSQDMTQETWCQLKDGGRELCHFLTSYVNNTRVGVALEDVF